MKEEEEKEKLNEGVENVIGFMAWRRKTKQQWGQVWFSVLGRGRRKVNKKRSEACHVPNTWAFK